MTKTYVALDLETTGLNPDRDAVIEIGCVAFDRAGILDEFTSFVYPARSIPPEITHLTGITEAMVADAPTLTNLRPQLRRFIGDKIIVAHNADFDLGFLQAAQFGLRNSRLDTVTIASILLPQIGKYSLDALVRYLDLPNPNGNQAHRALADARQTVALYLALLQIGQEMSFNHLNEIVRAGQRIGWPETLFFEELLAESARQSFVRSKPGLDTLFYPGKLDGHSLNGLNNDPKPIDVEAIAGMLRPNGNFSHMFPNYEYRQQQYQMVKRVAEAFNQGQHLFIEAGTGTGKSVGYLLPAAFWADLNNRPVVVSTNTINLQDQLINKDIPQLQKILIFELRAAILKGKRNYLCTRLFEQLRHRGPINKDEMSLYARILNWLPKSETGDVTEIVLRTPEERLSWGKLNAENDVCTRDVCTEAQCPLYFSRERARRAHLIVVNHSLLLADVMAGNTILPEYKELIIDEAHHIEGAITDSLSFQADQRYLESLMEEIVRPRAGILGQTQAAVQNSVPADHSAYFNSLSDHIREQGVLAQNYLEEMFASVSFFARQHLSSRSQYAQQLRLTSAIRTQPYFDEVELSWNNLGKPLKQISDGLLKLAGNLEGLSESFEIDGGADWILGLNNLGRDLAEVSAQIHAIVQQPNAEWIYWIELSGERVSLNAAPLHIGSLFSQYIFEAKDAVVLTSATMRTARAGTNQNDPDFDYIRNRLNGTEAAEMAVGSPFDYKSSTLLYLPTDIPEPNQPGYQRAVEQAIVDLAKALGGRTMVLFTSYAQLVETMRAIETELRVAGITLLAQLEGTSRQQLLDQFKQPNARTVLLGTKSFWEGVDVPGEALQAVVIAKIPFDVPSDPIFSARAETFDNSFYEYSIPEAVLRFRQGFGRLIRRKNDEGIVLILDKRLLTKGYGQLFLAALPECTIVRQRLTRLHELTLRWFSRDRKT